MLLFFIRRDELDIYDIPISYITGQFLEYIEYLEELDLSVASEFIYMAGMLMAIKAKLLLPREDEDSEEFDERDPRYELVQSLLEYKRYKEMAEELQVLDHKARQVYGRGNYEPDIVQAADDDFSGEALKEITMFDLMSAYKNLLMRLPKRPKAHHIEKENFTIEDQSEIVLKRLANRGRMAFATLCKTITSRLELVVTFLACLELVKEQKLHLFVGGDATDFYLETATEPEQTA